MTTVRKTKPTHTRRPGAPQRRRPAATTGSTLLHPDVVIGALSTFMLRAANPVANTLGDLGTYVGRATEEMFPAPRVTPHVTVTSRWRVPGLVSEDLVFDSLHAPLEPKFRRRYEEQYPETHVVYARRIRPASARTRPRLLYLHGYMQPETYIEELTLLTSLAVRLDVEVIQMQPPYHGRRAPGASRFSGEFFWTADLVRSVEALRQTLLDARTLLRWLQEQDDRPVGLSGLSLGGALTLSLACIEDGFAFAIPLVAHMDLAALVADAPVLSRMRQDLKAFGWGRKEFGAFVKQIGWTRLQPKLAPDRVLLIAASHDRFFDPKVVEHLWERWGRPDIRWYPASHMGFLPYLPRALRVMRRFVDASVD